MIVLLAAKVKEIEFLRDGAIVAHTFRSGTKVLHLGLENTKGTIPRITYQDGRVETVPQLRTPNSLVAVRKHLRISPK